MLSLFGTADVPAPPPLRANQVYLHASVRLDRTNIIASACIDSIDERGLTATCQQLMPKGELVLVTLRGDVAVWGQILSSGAGRLHVAFKSVIDLAAILNHPLRAADLCDDRFIPTVAHRPWRPGLHISQA